MQSCFPEAQAGIVGRGGRNKGGILRSPVQGLGITACYFRDIHERGNGFPNTLGVCIGGLLILKLREHAQRIEIILICVSQILTAFRIPGKKVVRIGSLVQRDITQRSQSFPQRECTTGQIQIFRGKSHRVVKLMTCFRRQLPVMYLIAQRENAVPVL